MVDFATLAQLSKPQMMPNAPSPIAGLMYGQDMARNDQALAGATQQAELNARMEAMKAEEAAMGQPGRLADINLKNASSQDNLDAYSQGGMGRDLAFGGMENKALEQEAQLKKILAPYFNALGGKDEDKARTAYEELIAKVPKFKNIPFEKMRKTAQAEQYGQTEASPAQINKVNLEEVKGENSYAREYLKQQGANTRQERELIMKREVAKLKAVNPSLHNFIFKETGGDLEKTFNMLMGLKAAGAIQMGQNIADQANAILPPDKKMPDARLAPALTSGSSSTATEPKVGNVWQASKDKQGKIIGIRREKGKIVELNVEGIGLVPYK